MARKSRDNEDAQDAPAGRYDEALLSANWNPVIDLLEASCMRTAADTRRVRTGLREEDVEGFLGRIYQAGN